MIKGQEGLKLDRCRVGRGGGVRRWRRGWLDDIGWRDGDESLIVGWVWWMSSTSSSR